jgi:hypothetical protein
MFTIHFLSRNKSRADRRSKHLTCLQSFKADNLTNTYPTFKELTESTPQATMARHSTLSVMSIVSLISFSLAIPLNLQHRTPIDARSPQRYSVVNVDGSSSPTTISLPETVTQTVSAVFTETAKPYIATVNIDRGSATDTVFVTVTPTATATPLPHFPFHGPYNPPSNATSTTLNDAVVNPPLSTGTPSEEPCDGEGWATRLPVPVGTGTVGYHPSYPTGGYNAASWPSGVARPTGILPSGMTAPFPTLPAETPRWINSTQIPEYRPRLIVT